MSTSQVFWARLAKISADRVYSQIMAKFGKLGDPNSKFVIYGLSSFVWHFLGFSVIWQSDDAFDFLYFFFHFFLYLIKSFGPLPQNNFINTPIQSNKNTAYQK